MEIGHVIFTRNEDIQMMLGMLGATAISANKNEFFIEDISRMIRNMKDPKKKKAQTYYNCGSAIVIFEKYLELFRELENHQKVLEDLVNNWNFYFSNELDIYRQDFYDCIQLIKKLGIDKVFHGIKNAGGILFSKKRFKVTGLELELFDVKNVAR